MRAAEQGITVTQLIDESLRERLAHRAAAGGKRQPKLPTYGEGGVRSGVDLSDNRALRDLMDNEPPRDVGGGKSRRQAP